MKLLLFILILFKLSKEDKECQITGKITENHEYSSYNDKYCVYLDTNEFNAFEEIIFEIRILYGQFNEDFVYYRETSKEPTEYSYFSLTNTQQYFDYSDCKQCSNKRFSYFFKKPKITQRYLIISLPSFISSSSSDCDVNIALRVRLSALSITLIVIGVVILVGIIILIVCLVKIKKKKLLLLPNNKYEKTNNNFPINSNDNITKNDKVPLENDYPSPSVNDFTPAVTNYPSPL